jgi:glucosamine--fructose-6-phosphate aminotransferase (isomerizing)
VERRLPAWWVDASELLHYAEHLVDERTLLWLTSQSGESVEVVELLHALPGSRRPTVVGLTNAPESTLAREADVVIDLHAGAEHAVSTRTFVNTLGAFRLALAADVHDSVAELQGTAAALDTWTSSLAASVIGARELLAATSSLVVVGRGPSLAAARAGALTIKEAAKTHAEALGAGAFRHGPVELAGPGVTVVVLAGDERAEPLNRALAVDLVGYGSTVLWIGAEPPAGTSQLPSPGVDSALARLVSEIAALQVCSLALAELRGLEAGVFRFATKVTTVQ